MDPVELQSELEALDLRISNFDGNDTTRTAIMIALRRTVNLLPERLELQDEFKVFKSDLELFGLSLRIAGGKQPQATALLRQSWEKLRSLISKRTFH